jgi:hypothetical protein
MDLEDTTEPVETQGTESMPIAAQPLRVLPSGSEEQAPPVPASPPNLPPLQDRTSLDQSRLDGLAIGQRIMGIMPAGWTGFAVIERTETGHSLVAAESWEVGHLVEDMHDGGRGDAKDKRRIVEDPDLDKMLSTIADAVLAYSPDRIVIEAPSRLSKLSSRIYVAAVEQCEAMGVKVEAIYQLWKKTFGEFVDMHGTVKQIVGEWLGGIEIEKELPYDAQLFSAALAYHVLVGAPEELRKATRTRERRVRVIAPYVPPVRQIEMWQPPTNPDIELEDGIADAPIFDWRELPAGDKAAASGMPPPTGPVTAGLDSGSRFIGLAILEGTKAPAGLRHLETMEVGMSVKLDKPREIKYANGGVHVITHKRVFPESVVDEIADQIVAKLLEHKVTRLVMEHVDSVHIPERSSKGASSIATGLMRTIMFETTVRERAKAHGIECIRVGASTWRSKVAGKGAARGDGAERIPGAIKERIANWVSDSNEHERDAAGCALYGLLPDELTEYQARKLRPPGAKRVPLAPEVKQRRYIEGIIAKRIEKGCHCDPEKMHGHAFGCPMKGKTGEGYKRNYLPVRKRIPLAEVKMMLESKFITQQRHDEYVAQWYPNERQFNQP